MLKVRLIIVNPINAEQEIIHKTAMDVLSHLRIDAEIKVINNEVEKRHFYDILRTESIDTDLIFMGIPDIEEGKEEEFVQSTNELIKQVGSLFLVKASSFFKSLHIGSDINDGDANKTKNIAHTLRKLDFLELENSSINALSLNLQNHLKQLQEGLIDSLQGFNKLQELTKKPLESEIQKLIMNLEFILKKGKSSNLNTNLIAAENKAINRLNQYFNPTKNNQFFNDFIETRASFDLFITSFLKDFNQWIDHTPNSVKITYALEDMIALEGDSHVISRFKKQRRFLGKLGKKKFHYKVYLKRLLIQVFLPKYMSRLEEVLSKAATLHYHHLINIQLFIGNANKALIFIRKTKDEDKAAAIEKKSLEIKHELNRIYADFQSQYANLLTSFENFITEIHNDLFKVLKNPHPNSLITEEISLRRHKQNLILSLNDIPEQIQNNLQLLNSQLFLSNALLATKTKLQLHTQTSPQGPCYAYPRESGLCPRKTD